MITQTHKSSLISALRTFDLDSLLAFLDTMEVTYGYSNIGNQEQYYSGSFSFHNRIAEYRFTVNPANSTTKIDFVGRSPETGRKVINRKVENKILTALDTFLNQ